jgi:hypothetical protein
MIVGYRAKDWAVFLLGFAKNERENIEHDEMLSLSGTCATMAYSRRGHAAGGA